MSGWTLADPVPAFAPARLPNAPPVLTLKANLNLSDMHDPLVARINLGLGSAATRDVGTAAGTVAAGDDPRFTSLQAQMDALQIQVAALKAQVAALMASMTLSSAPLPITSRFTLRNGGAVQLRNGSFVAHR